MKKLIPGLIALGCLSACSPPVTEQSPNANPQGGTPVNTNPSEPNRGNTYNPQNPSQTPAR